jgi:3-oxoacyl-[acyl-carrier-protein] synthase II
VIPAIAITGYGVVTAFGEGADRLRAGVFAGVPGFRRVTRFDPTPYRCHYAAEGAVTERELDVAMRCGRAALEMAGLDAPLRGAVLLGTTGDFTEINRFWRADLGGEPLTAPDRLANSMPGQLADRVARGIGVEGRRLAFNNGCVASSSAIIHGCELILSGREEVALCGGCSIVDEEFFAKFDSGRALAKEPWLRAFSADRSGLLLGDGCAFLVLEAGRHAARRGAPCLAAIEGWGAASDAHHPCQPHPDGVGLASAIGAALAQAGVPAGAVGYVNAHGTGTPLNDAAETNAIKLAFAERSPRPPVSSTKSSTGHTLEAAGALETVISMIALSDGVLPPTIGYTTPDPACDLDCVANAARPADLDHVLTVNSAFGGMNTALLLSRV